MNDKSSMKFAPLLRQLNTRAHRAVVGQFGFRNEALNRYLHSVLSSNPGLPGSLVADPVFEATFHRTLRKPWGVILTPHQSSPRVTWSQGDKRQNRATTCPLLGCCL